MSHDVQQSGLFRRARATSHACGGMLVQTTTSVHHPSTDNEQKYLYFNTNIRISQRLRAEHTDKKQLEGGWPKIKWFYCTQNTTASNNFFVHIFRRFILRVTTGHSVEWASSTSLHPAGCCGGWYVYSICHRRASVWCDCTPICCVRKKNLICCKK